VLDRPLRYHHGGDLGPAFGAARLARLAVSGEAAHAVCIAPPLARVIEPDAARRQRYGERLDTYRQLYRDLRERFAEETGA